MSDWRIFQGTESPHDGIQDLPPSPSWRRFEAKQRRGAKFQARKEEIDLVNAALYLRRPLLVTGKPGTGKTSLAYAVARELKLGEVLTWSVTTRTTLKDGLYSYDAIGRLQDAQSQGKDNVQNIGRYIRLGALGTAMLPSDRPRALLIDEIDKSDIDLPNDLLHIFEEGEFLIPELQRIAQDYSTIEVGTAYADEQEPTAKDFTAQIHSGKVRCKSFPFVILTSNGERDFPPPFLRRCLRLDMREPSQEELERIVVAHLGELTEDANALIQQFINRRDQGDLATDQLLNAIYLVTSGRAPEGQSRDDLVEQLFRYLTNA
ncbi:MAG: MoxR family ATPase [Elainella sp. C42_A2020_010]|nr:MoxR family ATPase [Elainella sp. C42_A2020_010]